MAHAMSLEPRIEAAFSKPAAELGDAERALYRELVTALREGTVRTAEKQGDGTWRVNAWVKRGILVGIRAGVLTEYDGAFVGQRFVEKDTMLPRKITLQDGVRLVPGGASVRDGAYLGRGVVIMPPSYINVGAYVDDGSLVDSNALVGSCAQVGKRVHLSAGAQLGGVLEPAGAMPVVVEDDVLIGGNCGVYEGTQVRARAVLGSGVILTASSKVYDLVHERVYTASATEPLTIPAGAVVVPGARQLKGAFAELHGLALSAPIIVKYRDEKTDARTALESALRPA
ncbi:MAG: 2,3,4,5-tetrahydropyridine-2,6-dicarboxylate N-succinyltransferase [Deltaproteobacteria bacterium]|nr:2,3,4,5-tetrahydropyridine-2,6-dicarboxylate N-succinyltransferase [Deltaproteobacteria bacterium]